MESKRKKVVHSGDRQIISKLYHYLKAEYEFTLSRQKPNCDLSHLENIIQRTAEATGVTERTVQRILKGEYDGPSTSSSKDQLPVKTWSLGDKKVEFDGFTADVVRNAIQESHIVLKQIPTLSKLRSALQGKMGFDGSLVTLRNFLTKMGYQSRKTNHNKKVLVERHDIQMWRLKYIKKITEYRSQGRPIVYTNSTCVLTTSDQNNIKNVQKDKQSPSLKKLSTDTPFIIAHAGTEAGFIDDASLVYKDISAAENTEMCLENYVKWFNDMLLPNLPDRSVIVLDSYYNIHAEIMPTSASKISKMQQWLTAKGIQFDSNMRKVELYGIIKKHKSKFRMCHIDDHIKSKGFEVLRPPPYHPELNAIEKIWKILKTYVAITDVEQNMESTENIIYEGIENITSDTWRNACNSVIMKEVEYMKYFDNELDFIINLQDDNGDETVSEESSCDSD